MKITDKLSVGSKLGLAFLSVLFLTGTMGVIGLYQLSRVNETTRSLGENWMPSVSNAQTIRYQFIRNRMKEYRLVLSTDAERASNEKALYAVRDDLQKSIHDQEKIVSTPAAAVTLGKIQDNWNAYVALSDKAVEINRSGNQAAAMESFKESQGGYDNVLNAIQDMVNIDTTGGQAANQLAGDIYGNSRWVIGSLTLTAIVLGTVLSLLITRAMVARLATSVKLAEAVADGDLTGNLHVHGEDEVAQLQSALSRMVGQLRQVVGEVRDGVEWVSSASAQISTGNQDLSSRTEQTASSLEETASSMEELTGNLTQSADTARQANQLVHHAAEAATRGGEVVNQMIQRMGNINEASHRIADIIGSIDGIAFQTNILALNAAVEAARAGEHGKGFAVVASEVRSLAQRSAEAAKEIKTLISRSVEAVEAGTVDVAQAGKTMDDIMSSVRRVTDLMGEIATASAEQRDGIHQVNQAVAHLDQMTQQNAALVEQSSAASGSVREQAERLADVVSVFKLS